MLKKLATLLSIVSLLLAAGCARHSEEASKKTNASQSNTAANEHRAEDNHAHTSESARVPAFETNPKNLPATLSPEKFTGMTREAYRAVREIPQTIAQLPCYCHCDRGFGHKSLHSCFVDNHAAGCAVCVEEALAAYRMEKELKLTPAEIRGLIIEEYSKNQ